MLEIGKLPTHVAVIMDGNGRWAKSKNRPRLFGHNAGMQAMKQIVITASNLGIKYLTVMLFLRKTGSVVQKRSLVYLSL